MCGSLSSIMCASMSTSVLCTSTTTTTTSTATTMSTNLSTSLCSNVSTVLLSSTQEIVSTFWDSVKARSLCAYISHLTPWFGLNSYISSSKKEIYFYTRSCKYLFSKYCLESQK